MEPWEDPEQYKGLPTERCLGCGKGCTESPWGKWCFKCNTERMRRIEARLAPVRRLLGDRK
jgi:hypothetical protein